jgi:hypothetical protein
MDLDFLQPHEMCTPQTYPQKKPKEGYNKKSENHKSPYFLPEDEIPNPICNTDRQMGMWSDITAITETDHLDDQS